MTTAFKPALILLFALATLFVKSQDITSFLPKNNEIKGWQLADTLKLYKGDELYTYVDGGAEIFMEYGFKQIVTGSYSDNSNRQIQLEVYEMADNAAAYGSYTFYLNGEGVAIGAGQESIFIDYFGAAWKGNYLVVVSTSVIDDTLKNAIPKFAQFATNKINQPGQKPELVAKTEKASLSKGYIKYIEGNVGLGNIYKFIPNSSFAFEKGVSFENGENRAIVFEYKSNAEAQSALNNALSKMKNSNKDTEFHNIENGYNYYDYKKKYVQCEVVSNYIFIVISKDSPSANPTLQSLKSKI